MDGFLEFGDGFSLRGAVPEGDAEIVAGVGKVGLKGDGSLEVDEGGSQLTLLAQDETEKIMGVRAILSLRKTSSRSVRLLQIALAALAGALVWVIWPAGPHSGGLALPNNSSTKSCAKMKIAADAHNLSVSSWANKVS